MTRGAAFLIAGLGIPCATVWGVYLSGRISLDPELPKTREELRKWNGGSCVRDLFPGVRVMEGKGVEALKKTDTTDFFTQEDGGRLRGCLVVNWERNRFQKEGDTDFVWTGRFRLLWALAGGTRGFAAYAAADAKEKNKLTWSGAVYTLGPDGEGVWTTRKKREVSGKTTDKNALATKFPKTGTSLDGIKGGTMWNFMEGEGDMDKIETVEDSLTHQKTSGRGYWVLDREGENQNKKIADWSSNFEGWWEEVFGKDVWDMNGTVGELKGGWRSEIVHMIPREETAEN